MTETPPPEATRKSSYRDILHSTSLLGAVGMASILIGMIRTKVVAALLGPAGIGVLGLASQVMQIGGLVGGLGFSSAGTRELAATRGDQDTIGPEVVQVRRALALSTAVLGSSTAALIWLFREPIAAVVMDDPSMDDLIGWVALGVACTIAAGAQSALLVGLRRFRDIALLQIGAAVLQAAVGIAALLLWGERALVVLLIGGPITNYVLGQLLLARVERPRGVPYDGAVLIGHWRSMAALGVPIMLSMLVELGSGLLMRVAVKREIGVDGLGQFQASWSIATLYIGFVLQAMSRDYLPRLSAVAHDREATAQMVDEQSEVALLLAGPIVVGMLAVTPWLIPVLYSDRFELAVDVLRWQLLGDLFRVVGWSFSFVIIAAGHGTLQFAKSVLMNAILVGTTWLLLPVIGVEAAGVGFLLMTALHLPLILLLVRRVSGYRWRPSLRRNALLLIGFGAVLAAISRVSPIAGSLIGLPVSLVLGVQSFARVATMIELRGPLGRLARLAKDLDARFTARR